MNSCQNKKSWKKNKTHKTEKNDFKRDFYANFPLEFSKFFLGFLQPLFKLDHTFLIWPVFLWIAISPKLDYFSEIWFQITNPSCSGIRLPKFRLKISIHFGEIAIYKSGRMSINWSNLNRGCSLIRINFLKRIYVSVFLIFPWEIHYSFCVENGGR